MILIRDVFTTLDSPVLVKLMRTGCDRIASVPLFRCSGYMAAGLLLTPAATPSIIASQYRVHGTLLIILQACGLTDGSKQAFPKVNPTYIPRQSLGCNWGLGQGPRVGPRNLIFGRGAPEGPRCYMSERAA